jgi:hypothetical protein
LACIQLFGSFLRGAADLRGICAISDYEYEFQMALMNRRLAPEIETDFLQPAGRYSLVSSRMLKEVFSFGGDISGLVPPNASSACASESARASFDSALLSRALRANASYCAVSVSPAIVPLSGLEIGGPSLPVPTSVMPKPPVSAIEFPEITPVKVIVNGSVPPLDKLPVTVPFVPVTEPVAVSEKELAEQVVLDGQETTLMLMSVGTLAVPVIEPLLPCVKVSEKAKSAAAE